MSTLSWRTRTSLLKPSILGPEGFALSRASNAAWGVIRPVRSEVVVGANESIDLDLGCSISANGCFDKNLLSA
jgi:hypothetical protein